MYEEELNADQIDEEIPETTTETTGPAEETTETTTETVEPVKPFIKVKHSNADLDLAEEEAVDAIQQGLFVKDHGGTKTVKWMVEKAKAAGFVSVEEYQNFIDTSMENSRIAATEADAEALINDEFMTPERATEVIEGRKARAQLDKFTQKEKDEKARIARAEVELIEFRKEYPTVNVTALLDKLPKEISEAQRLYPEKTLANLYTRYLLKQVKSKEQEAEQSAKNKSSSTGSLKSEVEDTGGAYYDKISAIILGN